MHLKRKRKKAIFNAFFYFVMILLVTSRQPSRDLIQIATKLSRNGFWAVFWNMKVLIILESNYHFSTKKQMALF